MKKTIISYENCDYWLVDWHINPSQTLIGVNGIVNTDIPEDKLNQELIIKFKNQTSDSVQIVLEYEFNKWI